MEPLGQVDRPGIAVETIWMKPQATVTSSSRGASGGEFKEKGVCRKAI